VASRGVEAFFAALFPVLVSRGFRFVVIRRARLFLPAFTLKDPLVSCEVSFLLWTVFFFFGTDLSLMVLIRYRSSIGWQVLSRASLIEE
jgi:hypothetical protein